MTRTILAAPAAATDPRWLAVQARDGRYDGVFF
jgi:methylphosphotriester-DNA--protein-cysteine methyltransferase